MIRFLLGVAVGIPIGVFGLAIYAAARTRINL